MTSKDEHPSGLMNEETIAEIMRMKIPRETNVQEIAEASQLNIHTSGNI